MMHCGPQKGVVLEEFLLERYRAHQRQQQQPPQPFVVVELGSYCGYSAIRMARALSSLSTETNDFHIYSIDVQPKLLRIATDMTRLAGLDHCISFHLLRKGTSLHHLLQEILGADEKGGNRSEHTGINDDDTTMKMIHFCMLDHAKDLYLSDLLQLERHGHLRQGSAVAADNVIFARIDDYRRHVQSAAYLSTRLVAGPLEYQEEIPDGIGASLLCFVWWRRQRRQDHTTHLSSAFVSFPFSFSLGACRCVYTYCFCRAFGLQYGSNDKCRSSRSRSRMKTIQEVEKLKMHMQTTKTWLLPTTAVTTACRCFCDAARGIRLWPIEALRSVRLGHLIPSFISHFSFVDEQSFSGERGNGSSWSIHYGKRTMISRRGFYLLLLYECEWTNDRVHS